MRASLLNVEADRERELERENPSEVRRSESRAFFPGLHWLNWLLVYSSRIIEQITGQTIEQTIEQTREQTIEPRACLRLSLKNGGEG